MPDVSPELIVELLPTDPRLGRHLVHDPQSRAFDLADIAAPRPRPRAQRWARYGPIYDQGNIDPAILAELGVPAGTGVGCCTTCALFGLLMTEPFHRPGWNFTMRDVLHGYHDETVLDERAVPGIWPPDDTGSAALYGMKVLKHGGWILAYHHGFSMRTALLGLRRGPIAIGSNWYDSMFSTVERDGRAVLEISPNATVAGGHEWIADQDDAAAGMIGMVQSWGQTWGDDGCAWMSYATFERLLAEGGDVTQPTVALGPAVGASSISTARVRR